jgi:hypothetical protein
MLGRTRNSLMTALRSHIKPPGVFSRGNVQRDRRNAQCDKSSANSERMGRMRRSNSPADRAQDARRERLVVLLAEHHNWDEASERIDFCATHPHHLSDVGSP